jgi:hypothetical protein
MGVGAPTRLCCCFVLLIFWLSPVPGQFSDGRRFWSWRRSLSKKAVAMV